uniref:Uncharacterized protein n=1 Tax=viral metagenome TaxID=1070528 RepID=A0A6C0BJC4_9ZZZZ
MSRESQVVIPKLEPKNLFEKRVRRDTARLKAYNQILEQIHHRIYTSSQLPGNPSYVMYTVPPFILGVPYIDLEDCIVYLVHILRGNQFEVRFTYPNLLYISWKHYESEYTAHRNPIVKAMMPPQPPANTSKKGGGKSRISFQIPEAVAAPTTARSAVDYQPPPSFISDIQRPQRVVPSGASGAGNIVADLWNIR